MTIAAATFFAGTTGGAWPSTVPAIAPAGFAAAVGSALAATSPVAAPVGAASPQSGPTAFGDASPTTSAPVVAPAISADAAIGPLSQSVESLADPQPPSPGAALVGPGVSAPSRLRTDASAKVEEPSLSATGWSRSEPIGGDDAIEVSAGEDAGQPNGAPVPLGPWSPLAPPAAPALPVVATLAAMATSPTREGLAADGGHDAPEELDLVGIAGSASTILPAPALTAGASSSTGTAGGKPAGETPPSSIASTGSGGSTAWADPPAAASDMQAAATTFAERLGSVGEMRPAAQAAPGPEAGLLAPQTSVAPAPIRSPAAFAAVPPGAPVPDQPVVDARPGRIGREMGVEIARRIGAGLGVGGDELTVRLNPAEMGRIEVRLSFDERGSLRVGMAAESVAALDMLRRDSAELSRSLADAGIRADANGFRFDTRPGHGQAGQGQDESGRFWQRQSSGGGSGRGGSQNAGHGAADDGAAEALHYRPLRTCGRVDLMA